MVGDPTLSSLEEQVMSAVSFLVSRARLQVDTLTHAFFLDGVAYEVSLLEWLS